MGNIREDIRIINERLKKIYILYRGLVDSQGEDNKIESVKLNGTELPISNKSVNISTPTKTSELNNDSGFITSNKIEEIKVNGIASTITNKSVNIAVPTKTSQLTNDSNFITENKIETVKVNGVALPISNKEVDIVIPTDVVIKSEGGLSFKLVVSETGELTTEQIQ